jgi:signal peptidase II
MLCFLFAALIVVFDQFFKQWILRTLDIGELGPVIIPGVLRLTRWENDGAMLNILSGQQWLLAAIAFGAAVVLVMILLRYNEGFWGTLGLAAVLGGTVGNLADRLFNDGKVVDMFQTIPIRFPIFNIADIFITLGFLTFLVHFVLITIKAEKAEKDERLEALGIDESSNEYDEHDYDEGTSGEFADIDAAVATEAEQELAFAERSSSMMNPEETAQAMDVPQMISSQEYDSYPHAGTSGTDYYPQDITQATDYYESAMDVSSDSYSSLDELDLEIGPLGDYDVNDILREYGFDDD